jgi:hypothetical protein
MANDFSGDANCVALYRFESGALTTDSKGTNTLTNVNAVAEYAVAPLEGACSADFELDSVQYFTIADASLNAGFPFKNGDATKKASYAMLLKPESVTAGQAIFCKYSDAKAVIRFRHQGEYTNLSISIGYDSGNSWEIWDLGVALTAGKIYHAFVTYDDATKTGTCRIRNKTDSNDLFAYASNVFTNNINVENSPFLIGALEVGYYCYDGLMDEFVIFKDILTEAEMALILAGTYGAGGPASTLPLIGDRMGGNTNLMTA